MMELNRNLAQLTRSPIRAFTNLANATPGCIKLTIGEPDFNTPENIKAAAAAALAMDQTHYAPNQGTAQLRRAIAEYETRRGLPTNPEEVLVTVGACQALFTALMGILNPGDEIIVPTPGFVLYSQIATLAGAKTRPLDVSKTGFQIRARDLEPLITPRTKAIILNSPCNPTGTVFDRDSLEAVKGAVMTHDMFLICDNVYASLFYGGELPDLSLDPDLRDKTILCQSFSKPWAMTGWRVGYLRAPEYVTERLLLLSAATITAVPTFLQAAAVEALSTDVSPMREIYRARRDYVCRRLDNMGLPYPMPEGAFYVFADIRELSQDSEEFCRRMIREALLAAVPGSCFGTEGYIRLSYAASEEDLREGLNRLERFVTILRREKTV